MTSKDVDVTQAGMLYNESVRLINQLARRYADVPHHCIRLYWRDPRARNVYGRAISRGQRRQLALTHALFPMMRIIVEPVGKEPS